MSAMDLLPCPFCGWHVHFWEDDLGPNFVSRFVVKVRCFGCRTEQTTSGDDQDETYAAAIAAWNRRTPEPGKDGNNG